MTDGWDRRSFFRELLRSAVQAANEIDSSLRRSLEKSDDAPLRFAAAATGSEPVRAVPADRLASDDDLRALCAEVGLPSLADEAVSLALPSCRLTVGEGESRLGGAPHVPPGFEWPRFEEEELTCLARLRLNELPASPLPRSGTLVVFFALGATGVETPPAEACRVVLVPDGAARAAEHPGALPELRMSASAELTLPAEPLSSQEGEYVEGWTELRRRLAAFQGVELEELAEDYHALHRALGHPDAVDRDMALDAEPESADPYGEPPPSELAAAGEWRLLLQLSSDNELGISFGELERLFVWIREPDLRAGRFDRVQAFVGS